MKKENLDFVVPDEDVVFDEDVELIPVSVTPPVLPQTCAPCQNLDFYGECDGDILLWCDEGCLRSLDCSQTNNSKCLLEDNKTGYNCVSHCEIKLKFSNYCTDKDLRVCLLDAIDGTCLETEITLHAGEEESKEYFFYQTTEFYFRLCDANICKEYSDELSCFSSPSPYWIYYQMSTMTGACQFQ